MNLAKLSLASIALDLLRVSKGYNRGSVKMAQKFLEEANKRKQELADLELAPYVKSILQDLDKLENTKPQKAAEDALMYSILLENYSQKRL